MPLQKTSKKEIIRSSIQTFREKGYYRTTMADLANNAGLTKGAFYYHFKNKEDVMLKSLEALHLWFNQHVFSIAYNDEITKKERAIKISEAVLEAFSKRAGGCFFANTILETAPIEDTFKEEINSFFKEWEKAFKYLLEGKHSKKEAKKTAIRLIGNIEGSIILMQLREDTSYLKSALERATSEV